MQQKIKIKCPDCETKYTVLWNDSQTNDKPVVCCFCGTDLDIDLDHEKIVYDEE